MSESTTLTNPSPTGRQHVLELGGQRAVVTAVGASLREDTVDGRDAVLPFDQGPDRAGVLGRGARPVAEPPARRRVLYDGHTFEVPLTEHLRHTALQGLVACTTFETVDADATSVTLEHVIVPNHGYRGRCACGSRTR